MAIADYIGKYWAGAEVMYGVIIAMTFTSMLRGYPVVFDFVLNKIIVAALTCCIAWGIADGLFYVWERNYIIRQENRIIDMSKTGQENESAILLLAGQLDDTILRKLSDENRKKVYNKLNLYLSTVDVRENVSLHDTLIIIFGTFIRSAMAGVIVVIPFFIVQNVQQALIISNIAGIFLLFGVGYLRALERDLFSKVLFGFASSFIGITIAVITVVLGG